MNYTKHSLKCTLTLIVTALLLYSCGAKDSYQTVTVENKYELTLPSFLSKASDLNDDASLQYQNAIREFYAIVIYEPVIDLEEALEEGGLADDYKNDISGYSKLMIDNFKESLTNPVVSKATDTIINNMPAKIVSLKAQIDDLDIFYAIGLYQGEEDYYQLLTWTLANKENRNKEEMNKILYSLKEVETTEVAE